MTTPDYTGVARNHAKSHENRIHSDEIAEKFGFQGALVPGVTVFGLTSIPLTTRHGADWLSGNTVHTRFLKPAYHNDVLEVFTSTQNNASEARCVNADGVLLCTLHVNLGVEASQLDNHGFDLNARPEPATRENRPEISWSSINVDRPFPVRRWLPTLDDNAQYAAEVDDTNEVFAPHSTNANGASDSLVHPHFLLSQANAVLVDEFEMPAWIHVGSEVRLHAPLVANRAYRVFAKPTKKWEHKGHEFVTVYMAFEHNGAAVTEVFHTAIYRIAGT